MSDATSPEISSASPAAVSGTSFEELAACRRDWIETVLRPWCRSALLKELKKADAEWFDIAGRADAGATLWTWAWERFPVVVHPEMAGVHETHEVKVTTKQGDILVGFPDARRSQRGLLVLVGLDPSGSMKVLEPVSLDEISSIESCE